MALTRSQKVNLNRSYSKNIAGGNVHKSYYKHGVLFGDYFDLRIYRNVKVTFNGIDTSKTRREKGTKRFDSVARSRVKIYRLVTANVRKHGNFKPVFATYTFKEEVTDLNEALGRYRYYLQKLRSTVSHSLKYLTVPQIQWKRFDKYGVKVWHFHTVFFNAPKFDLRSNDEMWCQGSGAVNLRFIDNRGRSISNVASYIAGYITKKDFDEVPLNKRFYYASMGLIQPQDVFHSDSIDSILSCATLKVLSTFEGNTYVQTKYKL